MTNRPPRRILVLNAGSSTLKAGVVDLPAGALVADLAAAPPPPGVSRTIEWGADASVGGDPAGDLRALLRDFADDGFATASFDAVGYRVVHGGTSFQAPTLADAAVIAEIDDLRRLAPLHNGVAAMTLRAGRAALPDLPHVAVFDTAFHASLAPEAFRYPIPGEWHDRWGIRRYGFHGISVAWSAARAAALLGRPGPRLVVAHLGSGCSVTAVDGGRSVDTSMGLTPLEGLMMGTRSGSIDPGVIFWALREGHRTPAALGDELDHRSGLLGVSGRSADVRELLAAAADGDGPARLALAMFERRAAAGIAAAASALPRLDGLIFTGGIGEHAASVRAGIVGRLAVLGFEPVEGGPPADADGPLPARVADPGAKVGAPAPNEAGDAGAGVGSPARGQAAAGSARPAALRIAAREDLVIGAETAALLDA